MVKFLKFVCCELQFLHFMTSGLFSLISWYFCLPSPHPHILNSSYNTLKSTTSPSIHAIWSHYNIKQLVLCQSLFICPILDVAISQKDLKYNPVTCPFIALTICYIFYLIVFCDKAERNLKLHNMSPFNTNILCPKLDETT